MGKGRFPEWLKAKYSVNRQFDETVSIINEHRLHTVCQSADCPNRGECFAEGTATFLILGNVCTRACRFCAVQKGHGQPLDEDEAERVADAVARMKLDYAVITSVTRDDLPDGGAEVFADVIRLVRLKSPQTKIEVLTPDFKGSEQSLKIVADAVPDVFNHNIETVPRLYPAVRPQADYMRSLGVLKKMKTLLPEGKTKSGLMVGLGESSEEVKNVLRDLREAECDLVTIGQYLSPSPDHISIVEFITPDQFKEYEKYAYSIGFSGVASAPLVRSSYHAKKMIVKQDSRQK